MSYEVIRCLVFEIFRFDNAVSSIESHFTITIQGQTLKGKNSINYLENFQGINLEWQLRRKPTLTPSAYLDHNEKNYYIQVELPA